MSDIAMKFDQSKVRMELLDPSFTEGVAAVLTFGAQKYAAENWRKGLPFNKIIGAIHRHLAAIQKGEDVDPESGLLHIYHVGCNVQFLGWMIQNRPDLDDRWVTKEANEDQ